MADVLRRVFDAGQIEGATCLAVTDTASGQMAAFLGASDTLRLKAALAPFGAVFRQVGAGLVAAMPAGLTGAPAEPGHMAGRTVLLGLRNGQSAEDTGAWLDYHRRFGVDGAVLFVQGRPEDAAAFADALERQARTGCRVLVCWATVPLGQRGRSGAAPDEPEPDPWQAPLGEEVLFEALRHRFLDCADVVAALDVGDFLIGDGGSAFDRARAAPGKAVMLRGRETFACHGGAGPAADHVFVRRRETGWLVRWAAAPGGLPEAAVWRESGVAGVGTLTPPSPFARATGVRHPDAGPGALAPAGDLIGDREVAVAFEAAFGRRAARRPLSASRVPRSPVAIVTTMKNEGPYIVDWVAHHRVIGVDRFLVYTNDCEDGSEVLLGALADQGVVEHRENPYRKAGGAPQRAAFRAARKEAPVAEAAWLLPLDVDEYLTIHAGAGRIADLFEAVPEATVLSIPWRLFGNADITEISGRPVAEEFRLAAPDYAPRPMQAWGFKSLFRNDGAFGKIGVHAPRQLDPARAGDVVWVDACGRPLPEPLWSGAWRMTPATWGYELAQINHYAVRSAEGFLVKRARGRTNHTRQDQGLDYWFRMNFNGPEDRTIDRYRDAVAAERARLMALPGVADAHARALVWHRDKAAALRRDPDYAALWSAITGPRMRALSRRLGHFGNNVFILGQHVVPDEVVARAPGGDWSFTVPLPEGAGG